MRKKRSPKPAEARLSRTTLRRLEQRLRHRFHRPQLAHEALCHSSYVNDYERLELLGDAVLDFLITEAAFREHPDWHEGELSKLRSTLAEEASLAETAAQLRLGEFIRVGGSESRGLQVSILADVFEALIAALYLDSGLRAARALVLRCFQKAIRKATRKHLDRSNFKSRLQEVLQSAGYRHPAYRLEHQKGPAHSRRFLISVTLGGKCYKGEGNSKQAAEQAAAHSALRHLRQWIHRLHA
jgi:ribonuclease-3